jgi:N5-(cytidine 5'-diphosphoramidyl)-L-glutamine hydrolase
MAISRVAISQRTINNERYHEPRDALAHDWHDWLRNSLPSAALLAVPNSPDQIDTWWASCVPEMLILSGGNDWGESPLRDQTETKLFAKARKASIPIFGVCRGLHTVNALLDGRLPVNISDASEIEHVACDHGIEIKPEMAASLGQPSRQSVNSFHNQGLSEGGVSEHLGVFATSEDGLVEGVYHPTESILAVQWHPERNSRSAFLDKVLLDALIEKKCFWNGK